MGNARTRVIARILYGGLFVLVLPLLLVVWAAAVSSVVRVPSYREPIAGVALLAAGLALGAAGMWSLWRVGGGLPMNAFPPPRPVNVGVYGWISHPIYLGFVLACAGVSFLVGSASGLWLVTPLAAAGSAALVVGYERLDLRRRFGDALLRPRIVLPPDAPGAPTAWQRLGVYVYVLLPWLIAYEAVQFMGVPHDAVDSRLAFEIGWPVIEWTELVYASVYPLVVLAPLLAASARTLRRFALTGIVSTVVVTLIYLTVPLIAPPRTFEPTTLLGRLLAHEQAFNHTVAAFPAFHVIWALIAAEAWPRWRIAAFVWALLITASCVTTGMHSLADIVFALALFPLLRRYDVIWEWLRRSSEGIANSWREWRVGPVRVINHGAWAGLAAATGTAIAGWLAGPEQLSGVLLVAITAVIGAGLWAQWLEGSSVLLRPFGFYGGLIGGMLGGAATGLLGMSAWTVFGAYGVALPFIQGIGRLRCLVQGCCHGGPAPEHIGIRYRHGRSRVTQIAGLAGQPIHPTPLYSTLGNAVIAALLLRLWFLHVPASFVFGACLVLNGLARFVEESYRAEPQTPNLAGLHVYHWLAIGSIATGMLLATLDSPLTAAPVAPGITLLIAAFAIGLVVAFAMGVDFPDSNRRFSRLASADGPARPLDRDAFPPRPS